MEKIQANGITLAYEIQGAGHPLVLISGLAYGAWMWHRLTPLLAEHFRVITFDNRGAGASDKPAGPYTAAMMADDTLGLLDALDIPQAYVMGISMGGFIAQEMVLRAPAHVTKLILAATHCGGPDAIPPPPEALKVMTDRTGDRTDLLLRGFRISTAPGFRDRHPEIIQDLLAYRLTEPVAPTEYAAQVQVGLQHQAADRLARITCPTLILFGDADNVVPTANAELLAHKIPHAQLKLLPNVGHLQPIEAPQAVAQTVIEFLNSRN